MKVLKIVYSADEGGVLQAEVQYIQELQRKNIEVDLIIVGKNKNTSLYSNLVNTAATISGMGDFNVSGNPIKKIKKLWHLNNWAKKAYPSLKVMLDNNNYSAISFGLISFLFLANKLAQNKDIRCYWFMHSHIKSKSFVSVLGFILKELQIIPIANSEFTRDSFRGHCKHILYPGFDIARTTINFVGKSFREEYQVNNNTIVFGIAARIDGFRAQDIVVEAITNKMFLDQDYILFIAGIIQSKKVYERIKAIAGEEFGRKIVYLGDLNDMSKFYGSIDVLVSCGKSAESFGISVVEAMGSSLPIIASNKGGTSETVVDNYNGWTFENYDLEAYKTVFKRVFEDKSKIREYGENSLKMVNKFSVENNVDEFIRILKS